MLNDQDFQKKHPDMEISNKPNRMRADQYLLDVAASLLRRDLRRAAQQRREAAYRRINAPRRRARAFRQKQTIN
jgi:hypothetical protein